MSEGPKVRKLALGVTGADLARLKEAESGGRPKRPAAKPTKPGKSPGRRPPPLKPKPRAGSKRKAYRCSRCGKTGHSVRRCPQDGPATVVRRPRPPKGIRLGSLRELIVRIVDERLSEILGEALS